ncbi:hypothetical protein LFYK43_07410 [Ligilactobacillus salitolerans]|uniref:Uncharacterized protein n=1 Tax=Ligilactobacillus salitolerans TaxID=1808352 RepID=A0A401IRX2_9LACO|nr:CRISPR-associated protein Csn2-St [Ligilactobacillus salitolerans]GBG94282.1 hypothetical protein LFYK43_07410 [Ligilactobacillus salitolerans]
MNLKVEVENSAFLDVDIKNILYFTGSNQDLLWKFFRSFSHYEERNNELTSNVYGENGIEISLGDQPLSPKNNIFHFIDSRESIYQQMTYHKPSLLFSYLNSFVENNSVSKSIERINDELYKLNFVLQDLSHQFSDSLNIDLKDIDYLSLLKNNLQLGYLESDKFLPLEFMNTDELVDEYLNLIRKSLAENSNTHWIILYNLDNYISKKKSSELVDKLKELSQSSNLKIIYINNNLNALKLDPTDIEKIVVVSKESTQLPPYDLLLNSFKLHYPNSLLISDQDFVDSICRIVPFIGNKGEDVYLTGKDLVLLKIANILFDYETSFDQKYISLTTSEVEFLNKQEP